MRFARALAVALALAAPAAHAAYFGKNKVQYKSFEWHVLETPHFEILFYEGADSVVQDAARLAERSYAQLAALLGHEFSRRIPLILYASHADFQQTNITESFIDTGTGGITDLLRRRVFLPFTGSYGELEHVLTHELVHAFELDMLFDPDSGDTMSPFAYVPPLWLMEGLAEYLSRGAGDVHTDMWVRDACLSGNLLGLEQLDYARDIRVYRFGQSIWSHFAAEYGAGRIGDLLRALRQTRHLGRALEEVAGVSLAEFSDDWRTAMQRRHLPELALHQVTREFAAPVVTRRGDKASLLLASNVSPDGSSLVYVSNARFNHDLYLRPVEGAGRAQQLVAGEMSGDFETLRFFSSGTAWSPDGSALAFSAKAGGEDALYLMDVSSGDIVAKHTFGLDEVQTSTFSPDGAEIVFVGLSGGQSDLYRVRRDGSALRRLTDDRFAKRDPQWSPDGRSIVYVTDEGPETDFEALRFGRMHLVLLDLETNERRDITPFRRGKAVSPAWSGDGESIAFVSDFDGISNIYILHLPTGSVFRLTDSATGVSGLLPTSPALSWARTSKRLVFSAFSDAGWDIYRIDDPYAAMRPVECEPGVIAAVDAAAATAEIAAAAAAAPETADFHVRDYKVRLTPDLSQVGGVVGYETGFGGQSQLHFSDLLGNHNLALGVGIYGSIQDSDLYASYMNRASRLNYALAAFQFKKRYGIVGSRTSVDTERQTYRGIQATAIRPFDKFRRLEATLQLAGVAGRFYLGQTAQEAAAAPQTQEVRTFVGPGIAYVHDSALFGPTGPIKGRRVRLSAEGAIGQIRFATLEADVRQYWHLYRWYAIAGRLYAATSRGDTPQTFYLGGGQTLRGYDYGTLLGNNALLASLEFRFPLVRHLALGWPLPLELGNVQGVLFADAASAWDETAFRTSRAVRSEATGRAPLLAVGFGTRLSLGYLVLKLDWAQRYDTGTGARSTGANVTLGADF